MQTSLNIIFGLLGLTTAVAVFLLSDVIKILFSVENYSTYKKRRRQLESYKNKSGNKDLSDEQMIDFLTKPIIRHVFDKNKPKGLEQLEKKLRLVGWDKTFTAQQFKAIEILAGAVGVFLFIVFNTFDELFLGIIVGGATGFFPTLMLKNSYGEVKTKLLAGFPNFIRIVQGYLTINLPFVTCVEKSLKFLSPSWQSLLEEFIILCNTRSIEEALGWLKNETDIFEIKEFVSLVKLSLEQGGTVKESFDEQAHKVSEILQDLVSEKIEKRRIMGILVHVPLLFCCFTAFGLPTIGEFMNLGNF